MINPRTTAARRAASVAFGVYLVVLAGAAWLPLPGAMPAHAHVATYNLVLARPDQLGLMALAGDPHGC